jgi:hypothetical protein
LKAPICAETPSTSGTGVVVGVAIDETLVDVETLDAVVLPEITELDKLVKDETEEVEEEDDVAPSRYTCMRDPAPQYWLLLPLQVIPHCESSVRVDVAAMVDPQ